MPYLLDADWAVYALAKRPDIHKTFDQLAPEGIFLSWVTIGETHEGRLAQGDGSSTLPRSADSSDRLGCSI